MSIVKRIQKVDLGSIAKKLEGKKLRVGFFAGATEADGTPVAQVALWNEYGTATSPPRAFMRNTIKEKSKGWGKSAAELLKGNDSGVALGLMGDGIAGQVKETIENFTDPPNAESTVKRKGFNSPLRDTLTMRDSVDSEVVDD